MVETLNIAICLFPNVTTLDFQGAVELFSFISPESVKKRGIETSHVLRLTFLSHSLEPVTNSGPGLVPQSTYNDALTSNTQYDIVFVPGGATARPENAHADLMRFLIQQIPGTRYVLSVCTGSWILAGTGILDGKRATTNKSYFKAVKEATSDKIDWVAKARWVVDGKVWTSSGVTAGMDMANAFLIHLVGEEVAKTIRGVIELSARNQDDDEFAAFYGLV